MSQPLLSPPQRPLPIRALNRVGGWLVRGGLVSGRLEVDGLLARARRATRLADFGPSEHREALEVLVDSLNRDAKLNAFGRFFATRQLMELLTQRLQLVDARKHDPAIAEQRIERPLIVMGLPRTGTTLLYGLLAQDPANRSPLSWEVDDPCPPPRARHSAVASPMPDEAPVTIATDVPTCASPRPAECGLLSGARSMGGLGACHHALRPTPRPWESNTVWLVFFPVRRLGCAPCRMNSPQPTRSSIRTRARRVRWLGAS
jgi:hypothetical protein